MQVFTNSGINSHPVYACKYFSPWGYLPFVFAKHLRKPVCKHSGWFYKCSDCSEGVTSDLGRLLVPWGGWWSAEAVYSLSRILSVPPLPHPPPPCVTDNLWTRENARQTGRSLNNTGFVWMLFTQGQHRNNEELILQTSVQKVPCQLLCKPPIVGGEELRCSATIADLRIACISSLCLDVSQELCLHFITLK